MRRAGLVYLLFLWPLNPALAAAVKVWYQGVIEFSSIPEVPVGTPFSGSFAYDTNAIGEIHPDRALWPYLTPESFSIDIAGSQLHTYRTADANWVRVYCGPPVVPGTCGAPQFEAAAGDNLIGSGPLSVREARAFVTFLNSASPAFPALQLPSPFPTDFQSTRFVLVSGPIGDSTTASGDLTAYGTVPEPATALLVAAVLVGIAWRARYEQYAGAREEPRWKKRDPRNPEHRFSRSPDQ